MVFSIISHHNIDSSSVSYACGSVNKSVTLKLRIFVFLYALQLLFLGEFYVYVVSIKRLFINRTYY